MKTAKITIGFCALALIMLLLGCSSPVSLTSWKNPNSNKQISNVVVIALFDKLNYIQSMEDAFYNYFSTQGLKTVKSLSFMVPYQTYQMADLKKKLDSLGADGLLILTSKGADVSVDYNQPTYYGFYGRFGGGIAATGGGVYTSTTYNVRANLYTTADDGLLWTGDLAVTDPNDVGGAMTQMAQSVYGDWVKNAVLKYPPAPATK